MRKLLYLVLAFTSAEVLSSEFDYLYPFKNPSFNSYGSAGLIQMPSARLNKSGSLAFIYSNYNPYQRIALTAYPFEWLEATYQYTDIATSLYSSVKEFSGNQTYKDKGFDIKLLITKEKEYLPQISIGFRDIAGTGLFSSEYIVASKNIRNIDLSAGIGFGNMSGINSSIKNPLYSLSDRFKERQSFSNSGSLGGEFSADTFFKGESVGLFGGIEYFFSSIKGLRLKLEYDSTDYLNEGFDPVNTNSKINFGVSFSPNKLINLSLSSIRGNEIQFGFSIANRWGDPNSIVKKRNYKAKIDNSREYKFVNNQNNKFLYLSALKFSNEIKQPMRSANISKNSFSMAFSQNEYLSFPKSYGRLAYMLDQILPEKIEEIELIPINAGMELARIELPRKEFKQHFKSKDINQFLTHFNVENSFDSSLTHEYKPKTDLPKNFFDIGLSTQTHIGGPDRFFVAGLNLKIENEFLISSDKNILFIGRYGLYDAFQVIDNYSDSVLPHVRTDIAEYLQGGDKFSIVRAQYNQFIKLKMNNYLKFSAGIFEEMFAGYGFEYLYRPFNENYALGVEAWHAFQRDYNQRLSLRQYDSVTGFMNFYYHHPKSKILFKASGGRFLAKDSGIRFDFSRRFKSAFTLGVYFSQTDISKEEFGEGSFDKGFYFVIPLELFSRNNSRDLTSFGMSPVTRDGAAKLNIGHDLWGVTEQGNRYNILRDMDQFYD